MLPFTSVVASVRSEIEFGASVHFSKRERTRAPALRAKALNQLTAPTTSGPTVLIVDDDNEFVNTTAEMLRLDGYLVVSAASVAEATRRLSVVSPHAMLLDWKLPDGSALELLEWVANCSHLPPTALLTGFWMDPEFERAERAARRLGVRDCIRRGVDFDDPTETVRRLMDPFWAFHLALLRGEPAAQDVLAVELPRKIAPRLRARFRNVPADVISGAVLDVVANYLRDPSQYDSLTLAPLERFLYRRASRLIWNAARAERRRAGREAEYARSRLGLVSGEPATAASPGRAIIAKALALEADRVTRTAIRAWLDGDSSAACWRAIESIFVLPVSEQPAAIERRKDAFRARVKRLARRLAQE